MKDKVEFRKTREFGEIIGDTFLFIKQNFKPLMKAFIYLCGFFLLATMVNQLAMQLNLVDLRENRDNASIGSIYRGMYLTWSFLGLIIFRMLNITAIYVVVLSYISIYIQKGNMAVSVEEVWSYFKYYFLRILGSSIVMGLFLFICFLACFFPGVYVFPAVTLIYPIMILENASLGYSFTRSFKLIKDNWWITFGILLVIWIITYACTMLIQLPAFIITMANTFMNHGNPLSKGYAIVSAISTSLAEVFMIIPIVCSAFCYYHLVEQKESSGLLERIDNFGTNTTDQANTDQGEY